MKQDEFLTRGDWLALDAVPDHPDILATLPSQLASPTPVCPWKTGAAYIDVVTRGTIELVVVPNRCRRTTLARLAGRVLRSY